MMGGITQLYDKSEHVNFTKRVVMLIRCSAVVI